MTRSCGSRPNGHANQRDGGGHRHGSPATTHDAMRRCQRLGTTPGRQQHPTHCGRKTPATATAAGAATHRLSLPVPIKPPQGGAGLQPQRYDFAIHHTPPMTASLFALTGEALQIQSRINQAAELLFSDDPAEVAEATSTLESLISAEADNRREVEAKADAWCWVIDHIRAQAATRADHARRLAELAIAAEHQAKVLQDRLIGALQRVAPDETTWKLADHKITSRKTTAVALDPELQAADLPDEFRRAKTTYSADKTALAAALKAGREVDGAHLVERRSWKIG